MDEESKGQPLQWHPAFYAGIRIEFEAEREKLLFENEHQLGTKPAEIDVLIIKKQGKEAIHKNIGRIFRGHNIVEYKSPTDYLSVDDFYKVYAYACFYKNDTPYENTIDIREITITLVSHGYPKELAQHLREVREYAVEKEDSGIYYVKGDFIPIQILVTQELDKKENFWLRSLTNQLKAKEDIAAIYDEYVKHENEKLYSSVMNIIVKANSEKFEVEKMCDALLEIYMKQAEPQIREREEKSRLQGALEGKRDEKLELIQKKLKKGKTIEVIAEALEEKPEVIRELIGKFHLSAD